MRINSCQQSFCAKKVNHGRVLKYDYSRKQYLPHNAYFIQIDTNNENDIKAMINAVRKWEANEDFAERIAYDAVFKRGANDERFYVLSLQKDNLHQLDADKIIGMAETSRVSGKTQKLEYIQTHPDYAFEQGSTKYMNIGKVMVKRLQNMNKNRSIVAEIVSSAKGFYEKMGFQVINPEYLIYKWKRVKH